MSRKNDRVVTLGLSCDMKSWVGTKYLVLCRSYNVPTYSRNLQKEVSNMQGALPPPNTIHTMVHDQAFRIITRQPPLIDKAGPDLDEERS